MILPYCLILLCVAIFSVATPYYVNNNKVRESLSDVHTYQRFHISAQMVALLSMPQNIINVMLDLHMANDTTLWRSDGKIPMNVETSRRLCTVLKDIDPLGLLTFVYIASASRDEIGLCARGLHTSYLAAIGRREKDNAIREILAIDPHKADFVQPPLVLQKLEPPLYVRDIVYNLTETGKLIDTWKQEVIAGRKPRMRRWNIERFLFLRYVYTYPFMEKGNIASFVKIAVDIERAIHFAPTRECLPALKGVLVIEALSNGNDGGDDVFQMPVIGNIWMNGCKTSADTCECLLGIQGHGIFDHALNYVGVNERVESPKTVGDVTEPLMRKALDFVDMKTVLAKVRRGERFFTEFPYNGSFATFSIAMLEYGVGPPVIVAIVLSPLFLEHFWSSCAILLVVLTITTVGGAVLTFCFVTVCISHPLISVSGELREAADVEISTHASRTHRNKKTRNSVLAEIFTLQMACASLRDQMSRLRLFLPQEFFRVARLTEYGKIPRCPDVFLGESPRDSCVQGCGGAEKAPTARRTEGCPGTNILHDVRNHTNVFIDIECSVVSVQIVGIESIEEYVGETTNIVMQAAERHEGSTDVFSPEMFHVNFSRRGLPQTDKVNATLCALDIYRNLPDAVRGSCSIVVDTGVFHFGVCGGPEKKEFALWGRSMGLELIHLQRLYNVPLAILQFTIPHIRFFFHVLPFALTVVNVPDMSLEVILYTIVDDFDHESMWAIVEETYCKGFYYLTLCAFSEARACFEALLRSSYITPQLLHLVQCQMAQMQQDQKTSCFSSFAEQRVVGSFDGMNAITSRFSFASLSRAENSAPDNHLVPRPSHHAMEPQTHAANPRNATFMRHLSSHRGLVRQFKDKNNVQWTRAAKGSEDHSRFPVFLGISETGTLATLKFIPFASLAEIGCTNLQELERAWTHAQTLYHENIVQILGHARTREHMCLIMEHVPGGTLRESLSRYGRALPLMAIKRFLVSVLRALEYLHGRGLVHGNVRPECIMMAVEGLYKLQDASVASTAEAAAAMTTGENRARRGPSVWAYSSPEIFTTGHYSAAADIYAMGVVLLELMANETPWRWTGRPPPPPPQHSASLDDEAARQQQATKTQFELMATLSDFDRMRTALAGGEIALIDISRTGDALLHEVLRSCLDERPEARRSASELLQLLSQMP